MLGCAPGASGSLSRVRLMNSDQWPANDYQLPTRGGGDYRLAMNTLLKTYAHGCTRAVGFPFFVGAALLFGGGGCATLRHEQSSARPWNSPQSWETDAAGWGVSDTGSLGRGWANGISIPGNLGAGK